MQRQAVPLLKTDAPFFGTGVEFKAAYDSGIVEIADHDGVVEYVSADEIIIRTNDGGRDRYKLTKFRTLQPRHLRQSETVGQKRRDYQSRCGFGRRTVDR